MCYNITAVGLSSNGGNMTVLELFEKYTSLKCGVRDTTRTGYKTVLNVLKKDSFGKKRIDKVKISDAKGWLIKLQQVDGRGYSSIHQIRGVLRPAFEMAFQDDLIRKNPRAKNRKWCTFRSNDKGSSRMFSKNSFEKGKACNREND